MKWLKRLFIKKNIVVLGNEKIEVKPIGLENAIKFVLLIGPYLVLIDDFRPQFEQALKTNDAGLISALLHSLVSEMQKTPGDIVKMVSLLIDKPVEWIALNVTAQEIMDVLPVLDKVNDFGALLVAAQNLGVPHGR